MSSPSHKTITGALKGGLFGLVAYLASIDYELFMLWAIIAALDVVIGVIYAIKEGRFMSSKMREGLLGKCAEFLILLAVIISQRVAMKIGINLPAASFLFGAFVFKDMGSILETLVAGGTKLPPIFKKWFEMGHDAINNKEDKDA